MHGYNPGNTGNMEVNRIPVHFPPSVRKKKEKKKERRERKKAFKYLLELIERCTEEFPKKATVTDKTSPVVEAHRVRMTNRIDHFNDAYSVPKAGADILDTHRGSDGQWQEAIQIATILGRIFR